MRRVFLVACTALLGGAVIVRGVVIHSVSPSSPARFWTYLVAVAVDTEMPEALQRTSNLQRGVRDTILGPASFQLLSGKETSIRPGFFSYLEPGFASFQVMNGYFGLPPLNPVPVTWHELPPSVAGPACPLDGIGCATFCVLVWLERKLLVGAEADPL